MTDLLRSSRMATIAPPWHGFTEAITALVDNGA
jgi:hypothetical protein